MRHFLYFDNLAKFGKFDQIVTFFDTFSGFFGSVGPVMLRYRFFFRYRFGIGQISVSVSVSVSQKSSVSVSFRYRPKFRYRYRYPFGIGIEKTGFSEANFGISFP